MPNAISSGLKTADEVISSKPCELTGVTLIDDGTNVASLVLYDHAVSANGTVLEKITIKAQTGISKHIEYNPSLQCSKGIFADVETAAAANYIVHFIPGRQS